jgi:hypothetical protein
LRTPETEDTEDIIDSKPLREVAGDIGVHGAKDAPTPQSQLKQRVVMVGPVGQLAIDLTLDLNVEVTHISLFALGVSGLPTNCPFSATSLTPSILNSRVDIYRLFLIIDLLGASCTVNWVSTNPGGVHLLPPFRGDPSEVLSPSSALIAAKFAERS